MPNNQYHIHNQLHYEFYCNNVAQFDYDYIRSEDDMWLYFDMCLMGCEL